MQATRTPLWSRARDAVSIKSKKYASMGTDICCYSSLVYESGLGNSYIAH